jgi:hypothetical protein
MDLKISMETIMISAGLLLTFLVFIRISYKRKSKIDIRVVAKFDFILI